MLGHCRPMDGVCLSGHFPGAALPASAEVSAAVGTGTGHCEDRSGTGCGRRFSATAEMSWVVSLAHACSEGEGLCRARIPHSWAGTHFPTPGRVHSSKIALRGCLFKEWDPGTYPASGRIAAPLRVGHVGAVPRQEPQEGGEAHGLPSWRGKRR